MMTPETKQLWIDALRSGDWKQCTGAYSDKHGGFCCLGVLGKIIGTPLCSDGIAQTGLTDLQGVQCVRMNDEHRLTFPEIADVIEKEF